MANIIKQAPKIIPRIKPVTPYEIYLQQAKAAFDGIRAGRQNLTYYPCQFGGLIGQLQVIDDVLALELIDFEVK